MKKLVYLLNKLMYLLLILFLSDHSLYAQVDHFINTIQGGSFHKDSICFVQDDKFNTIYWNDIDTSLFVKNIVTVELNNDLNWMLNNNFIDTISVQLICVDKDSIVDTLYTSFIINYDTTYANSFNYRDVYYFSGRHQVEAKITYTGVCPSVLDSQVLSLLRLKNEIYINRLYNFDCTNSPVVDYSYILDADKLDISWTPISGATEYDLEWTFYDDSSDMVINPSLYSMETLFKDNATRISTKNLSYDISLIYPGGIVYFRVRGVKIDENGNRLTTAWSDESDDKYSVEWHEPKLNWQYDASFVEDGKRKELIDYFDGTLRNRQKVTQINSDHITIVGEKIYDLEGRDVIDVMPVPAIRDSSEIYDPKMHFFNDFNKNSSGVAFTYSDLDTSFCSGTADSMSTNSGASKYYSHDNPDRSNGFNQFIPDAEGYPYSVTEFMQDNTGRIYKKGNVGKQLQPGTGHEVAYYYAKPGQEELDRIFGNDVGNASHYTKEAVGDANGQISVTYKDLQGRVIATALAGETPNNLSELPGKPDPTILTKNLLDNIVINSPSIQSNYTFLLTESDSCHFNINLFPSVLEVPNCTNEGNYCYDCLYDIDVSIESLCGHVYSYHKANYSFGDYDTLCENDPEAIVDSFDLFLAQGSYNISESIKVSTDAAAFYADRFLRERSCKTFEDFYNEQIAQTDFSGCNLTCDSCLAHLGTDSAFLANYIDEIRDKGMTPIDEDSVQALISYNNMVAICNQLCHTFPDRCEQKLKLMRSDLSPGGQYAKYIADDVTGIYTPADSVSIFAVNSPFYYARPIIDWSIGGQPIQVIIGDTTYSPGQLSVRDFVNKWDDSWSFVLFPYHPERCYYDFCTINEASNKYDENMLMTETYQQAYDSGYFNPLTDVTDTFPTYSGADPFFVAYFTLCASNMNADMHIYPFNFNYPTCDMSIWDYATLVSLQDTTHLCTDPVPSLETACTGDLNFFWKTYRAMYLALKDKQYAIAEEDYIDNECEANTCNKCIGYNLKQFKDLGQSASGCVSTALFCGTIWHEYFKDKTPRFFHLSQSGPIMSSSFNGTTNANSYLDSSVIANCSEQCNSYVISWMNRLAKCSNYTSSLSWPTDSAQLAIRLEKVCEAGCDRSHPFGSSSTEPGTYTSTYHDYSFQQIINDMFPLTTPATLDCNSLLIDIPQPFNASEIRTDTGFYNPHTVLYSKPPDCVCRKNDSLYQTFATYSGGGSPPISSYTTWLNYVYHGSISVEEVEELFTLCNCSTCHYLSHGFVLPDVFSCKSCKTCDDIQAAASEFEQIFETQLDSGAYELFAQFMNNKLGYHLSYYDYVSIIENECSSIDPTHITCDTLTSAFDFYMDSLQSTVPIAFYFDTLFNSQIDLAMWLTYLHSCGAEADTTFPVINCEILDSAYSYFKLEIDPNMVDNIVDSAANYFHFNYWPNYTKAEIYHYLVDTCNIINYDTTFYCRHYYELAALYFDTMVLYTLPFGYDSLFNWYHLNFYPEISIATLHQLMDTCDIFPHDTLTCEDLSFVYGAYIALGYDTVYDLQTYICDAFDWKDRGYDSLTFLMWLKHCGIDTSYSPPVICDSIPTAVYDSTDCEKELLALAESNAIHNYQLYEDSVSGVFNDYYFGYCLYFPEYKFTVTAPFNEYHYTLYYYDQGSNLVKTIPPKGVHIFDQDTIALIDSARNDTIFTPIYSSHELAAKYYYNTLNQVWKQYTPDADTSYFWYDRVGRLVISQNAKQITGGDDGYPAYSYTIYDNLGRIVEVGKISNSENMNDSISRDCAALAFWIDSGFKTEVTSTYYDREVIPITGFNQENLRNRVSTITTKLNWDPDTSIFDVASHFSYDISGNVKTLIQDNKILESFGQRLKRIDYDYDLASGKINKVCYQCDSIDQFIHYYEYDADNRLTHVFTSLDGINKENDAQYKYYHHGLLARTEIGERQVQGVDFNYNLQGWLKGINSSVNDTLHDMGEDGLASGSNSQFAIDAYGFSLGYFNGDYIPIGTKQPEMNYQSSDFDSYGKSLYNGNIRHAAYGLPFLNYPTIGYTYSYDQLNRLVNMDAHQNDPTNWDWLSSSVIPDYHEQVQYDPNGNILSYNRNASTNLTGYSGIGMDSLIYHYYLNTNRLENVNDVVSSGQSPVDLDDQDSVNYFYDNIGNLIADSSEGLTLEWNNSNKIFRIVKASENWDIVFIYDHQGNRVMKLIENMTTFNDTGTVYVRDAQGNVMAIYELTATVDSIFYRLKEFPIYGSSRLGILKQNKLLFDEYLGSLVDSINPVNFAEGNKQYELTNHLGNVLTTISDKKIPIDVDSNSIPDYYNSEIILQQDYYPGGMLMPGRSFTGSTGYRFGFNGKENDNEVKGTGNQQDYGMRIYDPRLVRFLSVDPLTSQFAYYTPYQFAGNRFICSIDLDGLEDIYFMKSFKENQGMTSFKILNETQVGKEDVDAFKNTDPNMFNGNVNYGMDAFLISTPPVEDGEGGSTIPWHMNSEFAFDGKMMTIKDAIIEARQNKDGAVYKDLATIISPEIFESDDMKATLDKGRDFVTISMEVKKPITKSDKGAIEENTNNIGHEFGAHAKNRATKQSKPEADEHFDYNGFKSKGTLVRPGSRAAKQEQQTRDVMQKKEKNK